MINHHVGDLFSHLGHVSREVHVVIPHICNNINVWGKGFTHDLSVFDQRPEESFTSKDDQILGTVDFIQLFPKEITVANMCAQHGVGRKDKPIRYVALGNCLKVVEEYCRRYEELSEKQVVVYAPKFGSGLAGGNWEVIESMINEVFGKMRPVEIYSI